MLQLTQKIENIAYLLSQILISVAYFCEVSLSDMIGVLLQYIAVLDSICQARNPLDRCILVSFDVIFFSCKF